MSLHCHIIYGRAPTHDCMGSGTDAEKWALGAATDQVTVHRLCLGLASLSQDNGT